MKFYYLLGRLSSPVQVVFFFIYNHVFHRPRARVLVSNENGELLLVRNWGGKQQWGLPGGGVEKTEDPIMAAKRELFEELGVDLAVDAFTHVQTIYHQYEAVLYAVTIAKNSLPAQPYNPWEITDVRWFSRKALPADLSPLVSLALNELSK